jgi:hypothetical protein
VFEYVQGQHAQPRHIDDIPWSLQTSFYPMSMVEPETLKLIPGRRT